MVCRDRLALIQCQRNVENGLMCNSLYNWVVKWCQENEKERLGAMNVLLKHCDLSKPEQWYGRTRLMHRRYEWVQEANLWAVQTDIA